MSKLEQLKYLKEDSYFMDRVKVYNKLKWLRIKKEAKLGLSDIPITLFIMLTSVVLSMLAIISLVFSIIENLTSIELTELVTALISKPNTVLWLLACLCLIPIVIFSFVVMIISYTCDYYYNKKELEKELKNNNKGISNLVRVLIMLAITILIAVIVYLMGAS